MNIINDLIKCISCNEALKLPVVLPCGHSICKHHVEVEVNKHKRRKIECDSCNETHEIPKKGFAPNIALEHLIKVNIDEIDLGEELNSVLDKCCEFEDLLDHFINVINYLGDKNSHGFK